MEKPLLVIKKNSEYYHSIEKIEINISLKSLCRFELQQQMVKYFINYTMYNHVND